ncbi:dynamin family protein [Streptomyces maoxianensis]|uniref:Dynamin family protein n=1 Tax=Streptomyces maoxianensis TaxID=1459942 RepID=A0ABV9G4B3_9ACTN
MSEKTLAGHISAKTEEAPRRAAEAIDGLSRDATDLGMLHTAERLSSAAQALRSDTFTLIVVGRFQSGKSTLLNALLGETTHTVDSSAVQGPIVMGCSPSASVLTTVWYSNEPTVEAVHGDGHREAWDWERYWRESTASVAEGDAGRSLANIREFRVGYPATVCQAGVSFVDTPGLQLDDLRTKATYSVGEHCDAAIAVYDSESVVGRDELAQVEALARTGVRVFTVVNNIGGRADEELPGYVWNRYVYSHWGGPRYTGQDLATHDIFIVDAERARKGRLTADSDEIAASGLPALEARLADFLLNERHDAHLARYATVALLSADELDEQLAGRIAATQFDGEQLLRAYRELLPSLQKLHSRPQRLSRFFPRYSGRAVDALVASFEKEIDELRLELPAHVEDLDLDLGRITGVLKAKHANETVGKAINEVVTHRLSTWSEGVANAVLEPILADLSQELQAEVSSLEREMTAVRLQLGWEQLPYDRATAVPSRILASIAGFALGGVGAGLAGWVGGWRGAAGGVGATVALLLGAVAGGPWMVPAVAVASFLTGIGVGSRQLEERMKRTAVEVADEWLRRLPGLVLPDLTEQVRSRFEQFRKELIAHLEAAIEEEEEQIHRAVEDGKAGQAQREVVLAQLQAIRARVTDRRAVLLRVVAADRT